MTSDCVPWYRQHSSFGTCLLHNPTGIPPRSALLRAAAGTVVGGSILYLLNRIRTTTYPPGGTPAFIGSVIGGSLINPLALVSLTYCLDRSYARSDDLLGYSGIMRELFYAGELTFLGAVGGGLGAGQR